MLNYLQGFATLQVGLLIALSVGFAAGLMGAMTWAVVMAWLKHRQFRIPRTIR
jgi:ABC-type uncharacterized transport system permease subunit